MTLENLGNPRYISLRTFRRSGVPVDTAVWAAWDSGHLLVMIGGESGKARRIRNNALVEVCASDMRGRPKGPWLEAAARVSSKPADITRAALALRAKYGLQYRLASLASRHGEGFADAVVEIEPRFAAAEQGDPPAAESGLLFVNGTLMRGLALHGNLGGADFLGEVATAPAYRLYSMDDVHPGMFEVSQGGVAVTGELYRVSAEVLRRVEAGEPPGLYRGPVKLADGRVVPGILYPRELAEGRHRDISSHGSWRAYRAAKDAQAGRGPEDHA